jgi:hypothetical protein
MTGIEALTARCAPAATEMVIKAGDVEVERLPIRPRDRWNDTLRRHGYRWSGGPMRIEHGHNVLNIKRRDPITPAAAAAPR